MNEEPNERAIGDHARAMGKAGERNLDVKFWQSVMRDRAKRG